MLTIQKTTGINPPYLFTGTIIALGGACVLTSTINIASNYFGLHYTILFFIWLAMVAIAFRLVGRLINRYNKAGWLLLIAAIICFAVAYYFVLLNILPDLGKDLSDVF